ncbi:hypothetical protein OEZ86_010505 [Tetradesmus obliquus]|nr:hypothetical protein OEZ86_010505 [Tetradesmus obliquus]
MTGLFLQGQEDYAVDDVTDRYIKAAAAAEQFLVVQFGLSAFVWRPESNSYNVRSFNFHLFPSPQEDVDARFMCQASSLAFLAGQGFDFNKMVYEGIPYLPLSWRDRQLKATLDAAKASSSPPSLEDLDEDELCLLQQLDSSISAWLAAAAAAPGSSSSSSSSSSSDTLYLPAPPPQLQKLQRRLLQAGIGSSSWRGSSSSSSSSSSDRLYIVEQQLPGSLLGSGAMLRRATAAQVAENKRQHQLHRAEEVLASTGFSQVFEIIRDSRKPAVGHNVRFDLAFCLAGFVQSPLPKTWAGYKKLVAQWLPGGVYDTKYLAHCLPSSSSGNSGSDDGSSSSSSSSSSGVGPRVFVDTALGTLYELMAQANPAEPQPLCSSSSSSSASAGNLAEWLAAETAYLQNPGAWQTLPAITHAPGCEAYAAAAAAAAVSGSSSSSSSSSSLAHEAGFDAFMTGVLFVGLLRLFEIGQLSQRNRWQLQQQPIVPPELEAVQQYGWRQYHAKAKDVQYAALQGPEVEPSRPAVVYLTGFPPGTSSGAVAAAEDCKCPAAARSAEAAAAAAAAAAGGTSSSKQRQQQQQ